MRPLLVITALSGWLAIANPQQQTAPTSAEQGAVKREREIAAVKTLLAAGSTTEAVAMLRRMVQRDPLHVDAHLLLGTTLALHGHPSEATSHLLEAIRLRPDSAPAYNTLGMALGRFARFDEARAAFEKAIELDPKLADAHVNLALILAQLKELDLAAEQIGRAIALQGDSPAAANSHHILARIYLEQGLPEKAVQESERAVRLRPDYGEAYLALGMAYRSLLDDDRAIRAFDRAVRLMPENRLARYSLGKALLSRGETNAAVEQLTEALRLEPDNRATLYSLSRALRASGKEAEARQFEQKMAEILSKRQQVAAASLTATALNNEGVQLEKSGNLVAALEKYRAALELDPTHSGFHLNFALGLCRLGRWEQCITEIKEILRLDPNNGEATKALYIAMEEAAKRRN